MRYVLGIRLWKSRGESSMRLVMALAVVRMNWTHMMKLLKAI